ncbi:hypothetical protein CALVIDRAFT_540342 [Calocera viscosa TUFC12733]|uniref:Uncharacterized protein n=1 Tax=Calocera viscosa (strain TUFC12733) TaxID=1330018 RepID=A0A167IYM1_CALVF|nr:hypothetical protein CALVIDRAFT_540342 [Calocera viscosa TUFC12733]
MVPPALETPSAAPTAPAQGIKLLPLPVRYLLAAVVFIVLPICAFVLLGGVACCRNLFSFGDRKGKRRAGHVYSKVDLEK